MKEKVWKNGLLVFLVLGFFLIGCSSPTSSSSSSSSSSDDSDDPETASVSNSFVLYDDELTELASNIYDWNSDTGTSMDFEEATEVYSGSYSFCLDFSGSTSTWGGIGVTLDTTSASEMGLDSYNALTFYAKSSEDDSSLSSFTIFVGDDAELSRSTLAMTTEWTQYIIPVPDGSVLQSAYEDTDSDDPYLFSIVESDGDMECFYFDDIQYEALDSMTVSLSTDSLTLFLDGTSDIAVTADYTYDGETISYSDVSGYMTFTSADDTIASVEGTTVTGVAEGTTTITGTLDDETVTIDVTVSDGFDGIIYDDALENSFATNSSTDGIVTIDEASTESVYDSSAASVSVTIDSPTYWGGMYFEYTGGLDASSYTNIVFSIDYTLISSVASFSVKAQDDSDNTASVDMFDYTPVTDGDWNTYTIPLSDLSGVTFSEFNILGFWNPYDSQDETTHTLLDGTFYLDDVHFE
jgi:hypothetical protein